jgi:hypothetical protein
MQNAAAQKRCRDRAREDKALFVLALPPDEVAKALQLMCRSSDDVDLWDKQTATPFLEELVGDFIKSVIDDCTTRVVPSDSVKLRSFGDK